MQEANALASARAAATADAVQRSCMYVLDVVVHHTLP